MTNWRDIECTHNIASDSYMDTVRKLYSLLHTANLADSDIAASWQQPDDASQREYYGYLSDAIIAISGLDMYHHWVATQELDWSLATRYRHVVVDG